MNERRSSHRTLIFRPALTASGGSLDEIGVRKTRTYGRVDRRYGDSRGLAILRTTRKVDPVIMVLSYSDPPLCSAMSYHAKSRCQTASMTLRASCPGHNLLIITRHPRLALALYIHDRD